MVLDIGSGKRYPANALSNFAPHRFTFDGVECSSMEGFLQSLKFENLEMQKHICSLVGRAAKAKGRSKRWWVYQWLYWRGEKIGRHSKRYQEVLDQAYQALADQSESFRKALLATGDANLTHSIAKKNARETILTRSEFTSRLMRMREELKKSVKSGSKN